MYMMSIAILPLLWLEIDTELKKSIIKAKFVLRVISVEDYIKL